VRFDISQEQRLFAESVRTAIGGWEPTREPELGTWLDDRDDDLAARLAEAGWADLWVEPGLLELAVAGGIELGRAVAPACLVDEATLGGVLAVSARARHGTSATALAVPRPDGGLGRAEHGSEPVAEATLDGSGTVRREIRIVREVEPPEAAARWHAWSAVTLAYFAGLATEAFDSAVAHSRAREQFGAPLSHLPVVQAWLADAALATDGLELVARASPVGGRVVPLSPELFWAGAACCDVTATAQQIHGALGFALVTGLHRLFRRAKAMQAWTTAACRATR
jgi:hypothetical protein